MNNHISRRRFIKTSLSASAVIGFPTIIPASVLGKGGAVAPSNRVAVGIIGCGNQSKSCGSYVNNPKSEIVAVCDPFLDRRILRAEEWNVANHYSDFRDLLDREDIDAVNIVTPDHWHVPISLAAARAGKDVYCEKPLGISIEQNLAAREIVEKHKRVFQYGAFQRSQAACRMGLELVLNGHIGEVEDIFVWAPGSREGGNGAEQPIPEGRDFDLWLGPAPQAPYSPDRVSNRGAWFIYEYAIGFIAGWGAHPLDLLQWWADQNNLGIPLEYKTTGVIPDKGLFNTAVSWDMEASYANGLRLRFVDSESAKETTRRLPIAMQELAQKTKNGTFFVGSKGWINVSRGQLMASSDDIRQRAKDPGPIRLPESTSHMGNFVDCVLSREQPLGNLESSIHSDIISHMGDLCIRTGETLGWDAEKETVVGSSDAVAMMHRPMRAPWTL